MRHFLTLDTASTDAESGLFYLTVQDPAEAPARVGVRREGVYVAISATYGPLEIALRPRYEDLAQVLGRLQPVEGLLTTRQVGSGQAYLAVGLRMNGELVMRPTLVADAAGLLAFNLVLSASVTQELLKWLGVETAVSRKSNTP
ncbi:MAG: hypothetical protein K8I30_07710 [Anaerolineae bacterium]|nr:hypothetical protein [Anaerolineae bacterium]